MKGDDADGNMVKVNDAAASAAAHAATVVEQGQQAVQGLQLQLSSVERDLDATREQLQQLQAAAAAAQAREALQVKDAAVAQAAAADARADAQHARQQLAHVQQELESSERERQELLAQSRHPPKAPPPPPLQLVADAQAAELAKAQAAELAKARSSAAALQQQLAAAEAKLEQTQRDHLEAQRVAAANSEAAAAAAYAAAAESARRARALQEDLNCSRQELLQARAEAKAASAAKAAAEAKSAAEANAAAEAIVFGGTTAESPSRSPPAANAEGNHPSVGNLGYATGFLTKAAAEAQIIANYSKAAAEARAAAAAVKERSRKAASAKAAGVAQGLVQVLLPSSSSRCPPHIATHILAYICVGMCAFVELRLIVVLRRNASLLRRRFLMLPRKKGSGML